MQVDNLVFSIPHRLLVIALRRQLLVGIDSLDALLDGDRRNILVSSTTASSHIIGSTDSSQIEPSKLDDPVILASGPRGLGVKKTVAASTALTEYPPAPW